MTGNPYTTSENGPDCAPGRGCPRPPPLEPRGGDLRGRGPAPRRLPHPRDVRGREVPPRPDPGEAEEADVDPRGGPRDREGVGLPGRQVRHSPPVHEDGVHVPEPARDAPEDGGRLPLDRPRHRETLIIPASIAGRMAAARGTRSEERRVGKEWR